MDNAAQDDDIPILWQRYTHTRDHEARDKLIMRYLPFAKAMASKLYRQRRDDSCPFDDYLQYARLGLMEAIERFDPLRSTAFEVYASYRIRGAVLNGLLQESEAAAQRRRLMDRTAFLDTTPTRTPQRASLDDFVDLTVALAIGLLLEEDEPADKSPEANPYTAVELRQMKLHVRSLVQKLPEREQAIVMSHYYEQVEFQAIAQQFGLTKGRVSQLHARALQRIRDLLAEPSGIDRQW